MSSNMYSDTESADEVDRAVDVVYTDPIPDLPYDERKVSFFFVESGCAYLLRRYVAMEVVLNTLGMYILVRGT